MSNKWDKLQRIDPRRANPSVYLRLQRVAWETATGVDTRDKSTFMMTLGSWMEVADKQTRDLTAALKYFIATCNEPECARCIEGKKVVHRAEEVARTGEGEEI